MVALGAVVLLTAAPADSTVLSLDLAAAGDGLITRDTDTGLDWLDLTVTTNHSWNEIKGDVGGWLSAGWRHATGAEVCGLFGHLGYAPAACPVEFPGLDVPLQFPVAGPVVQNHLDFLGVTWLETSSFVIQSHAIGLFDNGLQIDDLVDYAEVERQDFQTTSLDRGRADVWTQMFLGPGITLDFKNDRIGHYLVRAIPEPQTGLLLAMGLLSITFARRPRS